MRSILYTTLDIIIVFAQFIIGMAVLFMLGLAFPLIAYYTSWHWVMFLTFFSGPWCLITLFEWVDTISDWYEKKQNDMYYRVHLKKYKI